MSDNNPTTLIQRVNIVENRLDALERNNEYFTEQINNLSDRSTQNQHDIVALNTDVDQTFEDIDQRFENFNGDYDDLIQGLNNDINRISNVLETISTAANLSDIKIAELRKENYKAAKKRATDITLKKIARGSHARARAATSTIEVRDNIAKFLTAGKNLTRKQSQRKGRRKSQKKGRRKSQKKK